MNTMQDTGTAALGVGETITGDWYANSALTLRELASVRFRTVLERTRGMPTATLQDALRNYDALLAGRLRKEVISNMLFSVLATIALLTFAAPLQFLFYQKLLMAGTFATIGGVVALVLRIGYEKRLVHSLFPRDVPWLGIREFRAVVAFREHRDAIRALTDQE